jgi:hypothetical protein
VTYPQEPAPPLPSAGPTPTPTPKKRRTLWIVLAACGGVLALCCCAGATYFATQGRTTSTAPPLPEALHFTGTVNGDISAGINPQPHTTSMPNTLPDAAMPYGSFPTSTQCADYSFKYNSSGDAHMWEAIVVGKINGQTYALELAIDKNRGAVVVGSHDTWIQNNAAVPTLLSQDGHVQQTRSTKGGKFTVNADQRSGTIDLVVSKGMNDPAETHISGSWRCG